MTVVLFCEVGGVAVLL